MKKRLKGNFIINILGLLLVACITVLAAVQIGYKDLMKDQDLSQEAGHIKEFRYHCAFIAQSYEDPFWDSIYEGARNAGEVQGIYVENYGEKLSLNYSLDQRIEMAIAASVDAIIVEGDDQVSTTELIDEAIDQGIVVVTVYQDQVQSRRRTFVGSNKFNMGYNLCSKAYQCLDDDSDEIMVLFDASLDQNSENTILNSGMQKFLEERSSKAVVNAQLIDSSETYNTEEQIRQLLRNVSKRPKVIVCTNLIQTQCAYQTVVDLNCVGEVKILGFYYSKAILEGIDKGVIEATMTVDTRQMGIEAVDSINEYLGVGYVSDYIPVKSHIVDQEEARKLLEEMGEEEKPGEMLLGRAEP
ncbi:MAG TPA: substrate-binding domain-containing protein [Candidatus Pelethocola excrementipullorum]|nr:substrate-binding domain-containing protein [Candidatus Pelethocola excrementipullorum]